MSEQQAPRSVAAIVALVLGVIALISSWVPIINNLSFVFALVGVVFAVVGLVGTLRGKKSGRGLAIASTVVNVVAVAIVLATQSAYSAAIDEAASGTVQTSDETSVAAPAAGETTSAESADKYSIDGEKLTGDAYSCKISGVYTNKAGKDLNYVQVSYNLFDADGNQIGTALANTNNLADGGTWKFEAFGSAAVDEVASYKIGDVTGF